MRMIANQIEWTNTVHKSHESHKIFRKRQAKTVVRFIWVNGVISLNLCRIFFRPKMLHLAICLYNTIILKTWFNGLYIYYVHNHLSIFMPAKYLNYLNSYFFFWLFFIFPNWVVILNSESIRGSNSYYFNFDGFFNIQIIMNWNRSIRYEENQFKLCVYFDSIWYNYQQIPIGMKIRWDFSHDISNLNIFSINPVFKRTYGICIGN